MERTRRGSLPPRGSLRVAPRPPTRPKLSCYLPFRGLQVCPTQDSGCTSTISRFTRGTRASTSAWPTSR
eukprot:5061564-Pyramimonas_sp.AAC.1